MYEGNNKIFCKSFAKLQMFGHQRRNVNIEFKYGQCKIYKAILTLSGKWKWPRNQRWNCTYVVDVDLSLVHELHQYFDVGKFDVSHDHYWILFFVLR